MLKNPELRDTQRQARTVSKLLQTIARVTYRTTIFVSRFIYWSKPLPSIFSTLKNLELRDIQM